MPHNETLGQALDKEGSSDQKKICTNAILALSKQQCSELLEGHDVGVSNKDKVAFNKLCKTRVNKVQSVMPWPDLKLSHEVDVNW